MITQTMVQPSFWIEVGIQIQKVRGLNLFKFNDDLQLRLEILIERKKNNILTLEESAELAGITELDRIFTLMNARIIAESWPSVSPVVNVSAIELIFCVSTAILLKKLVAHYLHSIILFHNPLVE